MKRLAIFAIVTLACASQPRATIPSPRVVGTLTVGEQPAEGAVVALSFARGASGCSAAEPRVTASADGRFEFPKGTWGFVPSHSVIGPVWRVCVKRSNGVERVLATPFIGDSAGTYVSMKCDLELEGDFPCEAYYLLE